MSSDTLTVQSNSTLFHYSKDQHQTAVKAETPYETVRKIPKYIQALLITFSLTKVPKSGSLPATLTRSFLHT
jgi:hypothetical protein